MMKSNDNAKINNNQYTNSVQGIASYNNTNNN